MFNYYKINNEQQRRK